MKMYDFPNPKLNLPKEFRDSAAEITRIHFLAVENYLESVGRYIYTNINLDYATQDPRHIHAWIQKIISANVLRSLYLRNAFVEAFNTRNMVGVFLPLKSWFETVGVLAAILELLKSKLSPENLFKRLEPFALGNRGRGNFRIGKINAVNVVTMIEKADKYLKSMSVKPRQSETTEATPTQFFTDYYDLASNPSHPSFDAYELVGTVGNDGTWQAKKPDEIKKAIVEDLPSYGGLLMSPLFIADLCKKIYEIESAHIVTLKMEPYFE